MFRQMRRVRQALSSEACEKILRRGSAGVLSLQGDDGYPYGVPLSYVYHQGRLYFHCARAGHKLDAVRRSPKASFCVIDQDQVVAEEYTTYFRSVIAFGAVRILEDPERMRAAMEALADKYAPENPPALRDQAIDREWRALCVLEMELCRLSGKEAIELVRRGEA